MCCFSTENAFAWLCIKFQEKKSRQKTTVYNIEDILYSADFGDLEPLCLAAPLATSLKFLLEANRERYLANIPYF